MQCNTPQTLHNPDTPCFHFLLYHSQSFHLYFLASDSRFSVLERKPRKPRKPTTPPLQPTMHPVSDTCQLSRPHQSAEHRSRFPLLNTPNKPSPSSAKCQAFQSHLTGQLCLPHTVTQSGSTHRNMLSFLPFQFFFFFYKR